MSSPSTDAVVIRISPIAHFAVGFLALGMLALVLAGPSWFALLLVIPIGLSTFIVRYRTVADRDTVTARVNGYLFSDDAPAYIERETPGWQAWLEQLPVAASSR